MFLYFHQHEISFCSWMLFFSLPVAFVLFCDLSHKNWWIYSTVPYSITELAPFPAFPDKAEECSPPNWKVGFSIHSHWVNRRSTPWVRTLTWTALAWRIFQASACTQLPSSKIKLSDAIVDIDFQRGFPLDQWLPTFPVSWTPLLTPVDTVTYKGYHPLYAPKSH